MTLEPFGKVGTILDLSCPSFVVYVDVRQIKLLPPFDRYAPKTKSNCPPAPLICLIPDDSALTCPNKSTSMALLIEIKLSN